MGLRYQRQTLYSERSGVKTYEGLDPLTGLPVLIYEFPGKPDPALSDLESENIPGVLDTVQEQGKGQVVVAFSRGYKPATKPLELDTLPFVIATAQAISDAARAGVIHGDLRPERFLVSSDHVLIEGFGIPWVTTSPHGYSPPEGVANYAGDVYAFGRIMQELCTDLPVPIKTVLDRCTARKPEDRPSAAQLLTALLALQHPPSQSQIPVFDQGAHDPSNLVDPSNLSQGLSQNLSTQTQEGQTTQNPNNTILEIDFNVSEAANEHPAPPLPYKPKLTSAGVLSDMPDLDLLEDTRDVSTPNISALKPTVPKGSSPQNRHDADAPKLIVKQTAQSSHSANSFDAWDYDSDDQDSNVDISSNDEPQVPVSAKSSSNLPPKTSGKLPGNGPKRQDPKQTFIKDLPPGGTYKVGKATDIKPAPFKDTPVTPAFDEVFNSGKALKNTRRLLMVAGLLICALVLAGLMFFGSNDIRTTQNIPTNTASYIVRVNVNPTNLPPLDLLVISSPEGSKFRAGAVVSKVPGDIVLDKPGLWQFQARFQDKLSQIVTLQPPDEYTLSITMPDLLVPVETSEEPPSEGSEATESTTTDGTNP
ncbi:MAG: hypothetical protein ACRCYY_11200 [Trueperaceae bacterium]